jgi:hypothetical protein
MPLLEYGPLLMLAAAPPQAKVPSNVASEHVVGVFSSAQTAYALSARIDVLNANASNFFMRLDSLILMKPGTQ